jgi:hypothetical protein
MRIAVAAGLLALAFAPAALAVPPPAPQITVAATDIRQLEFNWESVPSVTHYQLWFRAAPGAPWVMSREQAAQLGPRFRIGVPVHLLHWQLARYYVSACNGSGCTPSNTVDVDGEQLAAMGFVKPRGTTNHFYFGSAVAASADGRTFAVLDSETMGTARNSATVHVYRKTTASSGWIREARLLPNPVQPGTGQPYVGDPLALSGDGNWLALGAFTARGADGRPDMGAVYLFRRTGSNWQLVQKIPGQGEFSDWYGYAVKLDDAAQTLLISHNWSSSGYASGTLDVYRATGSDPSNRFQHQVTLQIPPTPAGQQPMNCEGIAVSGEGKTILRACYTSDGLTKFVQVFTAPNWIESARLPALAQSIATSFDGTVALLEMDSYADVWRRGTNGWTLEDRLHAISGGQSFQRPSIALSRDGKIAALGNSGEYTPGLGPVFPPYDYGDENDASGGVIIWERKAGGWSLRRLVKPGSTHAALFGHSVALGDNGRLLIVGAPWDPSNATGFDGDRDDDSAQFRGAVWVY